MHPVPGRALEDERRLLPVLRDARWLTPERVNFYGSGLLLAYLIAAVLKAAFDPGGLVGDYRVYWLASSLALRSHPADAYAAGFLYPPIYLLICWPLALLPFALSALTWTVATSAIFVAAVRSLVPRAVWLGTAAFPAAWFCAAGAQNGLLSAGLMIAGFRWLEQRPILAGIAFGFLSYKPPLAFLLPVVLLAGGRWRVIAAAAATTLMLALASVVAFGGAPWVEFVRSLPVARLGPAGADSFGKLASIQGAALMMGAPAAAALALQVLAALAAAGILLAAGRRCRDPLALGSVTCLCTLVASPWIHYYDLTVLALPMAWLGLQAAGNGWRPWERIALLLAFLLPFVGLGAALLAGVPVTAATLAILLLLTAARAIPPAGPALASAGARPAASDSHP